MNHAGDHQDGIGTVVQLVIAQQLRAMRDISRLSDIHPTQSPESAQASLSEIFEVARKCRETYQAVLTQVLSTSPESIHSPPG